MVAFRIRTAALAAVATIGLSACVGPYGGLSAGYGSGYGAYGGYGYPGYGGGYGGYGYEPYWGWYDGFYYPGTGYYVYDRYRNPYPWDRYRDYWEPRRERATSSEQFRRQMEEHRAQSDQPNWSAFGQGPAQTQRVRQSGSRYNRVERSSDRSTRVDRSSSRSGKQSTSDFRRQQEANRNDN